MKYQSYKRRRSRMARRKRMILFRSAVILLCCAILGGGVWLCFSLLQNRQEPALVSSDTSLEPNEPPVVSSDSQASSSSEPAEDASSTASQEDGQKSSSTPQEPTASGDYSCFDRSAFVGNSVIDDLDTYHVVKNADFFARTGLTVTSVMTKSTVKGTVPVIDELKNKQYDRIFLMFGLNELGWEYPSIFQEDYGKLIDAVRERQPNAEIYIQSLLPVSASASQKNTNNVNNPRIREYNKLLKELAEEKDVFFLDVYSALADDSGNLPDEASADGIHPNISYCHTWMDYICEEIAKSN